MSDIVQKLWGFCHTLRHDGVDSIRQKGGKIVHARAVERDRDDTQPVQSNLLTMEWPPGSGRMLEFPEVDRAQFFPTAERSGS